MHPLSMFPGLLYLGLLAPLLLRLTVGLFILFLGKNRKQKIYKWSAVVYILPGIFLIVGLYTQIATIIGILVIIFDFYIDNKTASVSLDKKILYVMSGVILLTLLFTGPGLFAFDWPL
jgi:uncharacterized membrane protein YphA (DoxX/SURF4 family)